MNEIRRNINYRELRAILRESKDKREKQRAKKEKKKERKKERKKENK